MDKTYCDGGGFLVALIHVVSDDSTVVNARFDRYKCWPFLRHLMVIKISWRKKLLIIGEHLARADHLNVNSDDAFELFCHSLNKLTKLCPWSVVETKQWLADETIGYGCIIEEKVRRFHFTHTLSHTHTFHSFAPWRIMFIVRGSSHCIYGFKTISAPVGLHATMFVTRIQLYRRYNIVAGIF